MTYGSDSSIARFSLQHYQRMIETGILTAEDKVELLENYVVLKMPRNPLHDGTIEMMTETLGAVIPTGWRLRVQLALQLTDSQPEPDFAIARGDKRTYLTRHPNSDDIALIVEVADSSLTRDRLDKTRIFARGGILFYWIVNLVERRIEVFSQPSGPRDVPAYGCYSIYQPGDMIPLVIQGQNVAAIQVNDLIP
jgi:Uma2 family endonuclease